MRPDFSMPQNEMGYLGKPATQPAHEPVHHPAQPVEICVPQGIRLTLPDFNQTVEQRLKPEMMMGRRDSNQDGQVDIDLSPFKAIELGVSRYHAIIQMVNERIFIKDCNSTNGTYMNAHPLTPLVPYRLHDDDELTLGSLHMQIAFIEKWTGPNPELQRSDNVSLMLQRLMAIQWDGHRHRSGSEPNADLMREFLRRMWLWDRELQSHAWPLFDVAKHIQPNARADTQQLTTLTRSLFPNMFVRMTCHWALHWAAVANTPLVQEIGLPAPFEPLLQMYENGAWFKRSGSSMDIYDIGGLRSNVSLLPDHYANIGPFVELNNHSEPSRGS